MRSCLLVVIGCFLMLSNHLISQTFEIPNVFNFSKDSYGGQKQNWDIAQLENGLILVANSKGLMTYDGVNWSHHVMPNHQIIRTLLVEGDRIYVGSYGEFGYWAARNSGKFEYNNLSGALPADRISGEEIWNAVKSDSSIIFQSFGKIFEVKGEEVRLIVPPSSIRFVYELTENYFALQVQGHGIMRLEDGEFIPLIPESQVQGLKVTGLWLNSAGHINLSTENHGLFVYAGHELTSLETTVDDRLKMHQINKVVKLTDGRLALGTISDGLYIIDQKGNFRYGINKESTLQNNTVLALYEDQNRDLWLGLDDGISLLELSNNSRFYKDPGGQLGTVYDAVLRDSFLFIGTNHGLFSIRYPPDEKNSTFDLIEGTQGQVWDLIIVDDSLIFCGHNNGTYVVEGTKARSISNMSGGREAIYVPGYRNKIIQGTYNGLAIFSKINGDWMNASAIEGFEGNVKQLAFDDDGWLWVSNPYRGLTRLKIDFATNSLLAFQKIGQEQGLPSDFQLSLTHLQCSLMVNSGHQYFYFNSDSTRFEPLALDMYHFNYAGQLLSGSDGITFVAGENQVHAYQSDVKIAEFSVRLVKGFENISHLTKSKYLACLEDGYAILDLSQKGYKHLVSGAPRVSGFTAWHRNAEIVEDLDLQTGWSQSDVVLPSAVNRIQFRFGSFDFLQSRPFRYQLMGFDPEWSPWTSSTTKEYTNLNPGTYTFRLQYEGSEQTAEFSLDQLPAWYHTGWFRLTMVILLFVLAYVVRSYFDRRLVTQTLRIKAEKERELMRQRLTMDNKLLEKEILHKSQQLADSTMNLIQKNKVLLKLKADLAGLKPGISDAHYNRLLHLIQKNLNGNHEWKVFESNFNSVHENFFKALKQEYPQLTAGDLQLAAYLKMNLTSKEIAPLLSISLRGVENKRYRLRKKMNLSSEQHLIDVLVRY